MSGKPLVAHGLTITPKRPKFNILPRALGIGGRNPIVEVRFNHKGRVDDARIIRSSGNRDGFDRPVIDAMYEWTAKGKRLEELAATTPPGTVSFRFEILISR